MVQKQLAIKLCKDYLFKEISENTEGVTVLGIDGPTASGKTILADNIKEILEAAGHECWVYRLDWTLDAREKRSLDLAHLRKNDFAMCHEGTLHMRLHVVEEFLKKVNCFRYDSKPEAISLKNLYSRANNGTLTGEDTCVLKTGLVVILEGHYTLETRIAKFIDFNIVLLGDSDELLKRKAERVKGYRDKDTVEDYFWRIDLPSFRRHLSRFCFGADLVVDNTNYKDASFKDNRFVKKWIKENLSPLENNTKASRNLIEIADIPSLVFSNSIIIDPIISSVLSKAINEIISWDQEVGRYLRVSIQEIKEDLTGYADQFIQNLTQKFSNENFEFSLAHTNAIYNVYRRKLPITIGVNIRRNKDTQSIQILAEVLHNSLVLDVIWQGGCEKFLFERELGIVEGYQKRVVYHVREESQESDNEIVRVLTPAPFTIPEFLREFKLEKVHTFHEDENISSVKSINLLLEKQGVWIRRFSTIAELNFFGDVLKKVGIESLRIGNYLIACYTDKNLLRHKFRDFVKEWDHAVLDQTELEQDNYQLDEIIKKERDQVRRLVEKECPDFIYLDGHIQCKVHISLDNFSVISGQLASMLGSNVRLLRKRATQFILNEFPNLELEASKFWQKLKTNKKKHVSLSNITELAPSILSEIYLWLAIRGDNSAILGANIYDIRSNSSDCAAYMAATKKNGTAIVLQASLNAIGQEETCDGKQYVGYLEPMDGVHDLIRAATNAARDLYLETGDLPPLYGVGLDHINFENDKPNGRSRRFLEEAVKSELVTHYVLDGSDLFQIENTKESSFIKAYNSVVAYASSLIENTAPERQYLFDREICAGELNYIEEQKKALIPTPKNLKIFVECYLRSLRGKGLSALAARPTLFIGNLGTNHHGTDSDEPKVELSKKWKDELKRYNFVSAVLHGTTNTHRDYLEKATVGCHKINVAGDLLDTLVKHIPAKLHRKVNFGKEEKKKMLSSVRSEMDDMTEKESRVLKNSLLQHCLTLQEHINSPRFDAKDVSYFKYKSYKFSAYQIDQIVNGMEKQLTKLNGKSDSIVRDGERVCLFSASMIEVPYSEKYKGIVKRIIEEGIKSFHVDVGDGIFITRKISSLEKVRYLRKTYPDLSIHCHLMVNSPHDFRKNGQSYIEEYVTGGCDHVAVHERSFDSKKDLISGLNQIRNLGAKPGLIIETDRVVDQGLFDTILEHELDWAVMMGVVVGYGGQIFDNNVLLKINALDNYFRSIGKPFTIEVDGGLTMENVSLCKRAGAQILSGWSIINSESTEQICEKIRILNSILNPDEAL